MRVRGAACRGGVEETEHNHGDVHALVAIERGFEFVSRSSLLPSCFVLRVNKERLERVCGFMICAK